MWEELGLGKATQSCHNYCERVDPSSAPLPKAIFKTVEGNKAYVRVTTKSTSAQGEKQRKPHIHSLSKAHPTRFTSQKNTTKTRFSKNIFFSVLETRLPGAASSKTPARRYPSQAPPAPAARRSPAWWARHAQPPAPPPVLPGSPCPCPPPEAGPPP